MGFVFQTKNTQYTVNETLDPNKWMISGGQFDNTEIHRPMGLIGEDQPFSAVVTDNMANGSFRNQPFHTSTVRSIHTFPESEEAKAANQRLLYDKEQMMIQRHNQRVAQASVYDYDSAPTQELDGGDYSLGR